MQDEELVSISSTFNEELGAAANTEVNTSSRVCVRVCEQIL